MKILSPPALVVLTAASLALAACGSSEKATDAATADTVELPAEDAMSQTSAMPSEIPVDPATIVATDEGVDTSASGDAVED